MENDKLMISIIDDNGSKQFSVHNAIKSFGLYVLAGVLGLLALYLVALHILTEQLDELVAKKNDARDKFQEIYEKNSDLERNIEFKSSELAKANDKISELEHIINISKDKVALNEQNMQLSVNDLNDIQKQTVLKIVPSGNPIQNYEFANQSTTKQDSQKTKAPSKPEAIYYQVAKGTPVYATANGIIDSISTQRGGHYGVYVKIVHPFGFTSTYARLDKVEVKNGEFISKGQLLGYSGDSGSNKKAELLYELKFLDSPLRTLDYAMWNKQEFNAPFTNKDPINWNSLIWALDDLAQLQSYASADRIDDTPPRTQH